MTTTQRFLVFGRDDRAEGPYAPWWPLYVEDGSHVAESPEACLALIRERISLGGESYIWQEIAVVPVDEWTTA